MSSVSPAKPIADPKTQRINIVLAVKAHTAYLELNGILSTLQGFNLRIIKVRSVLDLKRYLKSSDFDLLICDTTLITTRVSKQLVTLQKDDKLPPVVLLSYEDTEDLQQLSQQINTLQTLIFDDTDAQAMSNFIKMAIDYSALHKKHNVLQNDTNLGITLKDTFSFRADLDDFGQPIIYWASKSFADITGYSITDLKSTPSWLGQVFEEDQVLLDKLVNKINALEAASCQIRCMQKQGELLWFEVNAQPQTNQNAELVGMIGSVRNITDQKKNAEHHLTNQRRRNLINAVKESINQLNDSFSIFRECAIAVLTELNADNCQVFIHHGAEGEFVLRYDTNTDKGHTRSIIPVKKNNEADLISQNKQSLLIGNLKSYEQLKPSRFLTKQKKQSCIITPILSDNSIIGLLYVYHSNQDYFNTIDVNFNEQICRCLATTISQATSDTILRYKVSDVTGQDTTTDFEDESTLSNFGEQDIESVFQSALDLRTRDAVMSVIARISEWFLQTPNWRSVIEQSMAALSQAILSPSAKLYQVNTDLLKSVQCNLIFNTQASDQDKASEILDLHSLGFNKFQDILNHGKTLTITADGALTRTELNRLAKHGLKNHLIVPIFVNQLWWGFMAFAPPNRGYVWPKPIVNAFRIAANIVGPAISRSEHEKALQALTEVSVGKAGQEYLDSLTKQIAYYTQADICFIAENNNDGTRIVSLWDENQSIKDIDYNPDIDPHNQAQVGSIVHYSEVAKDLFPDNPLFQEYKVSSYSNLSISINDDQIVGNLIILKTQPMQLAERQIQILEICSNRVGLELERMQREMDINRLARIPLESPYMVMILDLNGNISFFNPTCRKVMKAVNCKSPQDLLPPNHDDIVEKLRNSTAEEFFKPEVSLGHFIFEWDYHYEEDLGLIHLYGIDLTERRKLEDKLRKDAFSDSLTDLPNRSYFTSVVRKALEHTHRRNDYKFAVLFLDLDRFKVINDSLGHLFGDRLLQEVAARLKNTLRPGDTVARLGGDEFAILLESIESEAEATMVTKRIIDSFNDRFIIDGNELFTSTSIGIAISHQSYHNIEEIIRDADIAMYSAKGNSKSNYAIFDAKMHKEAVHIMHMENDLRNALLRNHLECYYQPIYSFEENAISGFEALVRWNHPTKGLLKPTEFIKLAEETGLIHDLDLWIFEDSCRQLSEWHKVYPSTKNITMSINLSAFHFNRVELIAKIGAVLEKYKLNPESIKLEVTESVIMDSMNAANEIFAVLKSRGMKISIDDFGVGYSSLGRLISLPVDTLKIDRSFIISLTKDKNSRNVTRAIIDLAQVLDLDVIAEGVETKEQANLLERLGCNYIQGFLVQKPLPAFDAEQLIKNRFRLSA